jgi:deazaflavin-dependent oxidoreductase (nitroreductase family)
LNPLLKILVAVNTGLYRLTNGRLGSRLGRQSILLLHTVGRKSGKTYTNPLSYYRDGDDYLIVASNWGLDDPPNWFLNLKHQPRTTIQLKSQTIEVTARPASPDEYQRLWQLVTSRNSQYLEYQKGLARQIPIVILSPIEA